MSKIKLDDRLSAVAGLVRNGKRVADIGTDHGYLVAYLVENGSDVTELLGLEKTKKSPDISSSAIPLSNNERIVLQTIKRYGEPIHINDIGKESGVACSDLPFILLNLEMNSLIISLPGNTYKIYNKS